ncbi:15865_t:CDS:2, partial [Dentiscutata erythropus]
KIAPRLPIEVLMSNSQYKEQRDLFLQGFAEVQKRDIFNASSLYAQKQDAGYRFSDIDPTSFYAVASIHGLPYEPFDFLPTEDIKTTEWNPSESNRPGGYCHHGDVLFPTWHRPYVLLIEMLICQSAKTIAANYPDDKKAAYQKAAEQLRFPYWDWASPTTLASGMPSFLYEETLEVVTPDGTDSSFRNPLRAYTLPRDLGSLSLVGDSANPTKRPYIPDPGITVFTPKGYSTVRHPNTNYASDDNAASLDITTQCSAVFRPSIYQTIHYVKTWDQFSNHGGFQPPSGGKKPTVPITENYGHYASIEFVHDAVHGAVGGTGGHMANPDLAAFDPIFFLHHCNVDRFLAIWQAINPNAWIVDDAEASFTEGTFTEEPLKKLTGKTNLTPFRRTETDFWTSDEVRNIDQLGYTYPELQEYKDPVKLKNFLMEYYHPNLYLQFHWKLTLTTKKNQVGSPFEIRVFLDKPDADAQTPKSSANYAGSVTIFARGPETKCANCKAQKDAVVNGSVDLTQCMQRLNIDLNNQRSLRPNQIKIVAARGGSNINLKDVLVSADYFIFDEGPGHNHDYENWTTQLVGNVYPGNNQ